MNRKEKSKVTPWDQRPYVLFKKNIYIYIYIYTYISFVCYKDQNDELNWQNLERLIGRLPVDMVTIDPGEPVREHTIIIKCHIKKVITRPCFQV